MADYKFIDHTDDAKKDMDKAVKAALDDVGIHLEGEAQEELQNSPKRIDTGLLRNSITHGVSGQKIAKRKYKGSDKHTGESASAVKHGLVGKKAPPPREGSYSGVMGTTDERAVYIGTNVEYAIYVHEGTSRMAPNRFLKNAVTKNEAQIRKWLDDKLRGK